MRDRNPSAPFAPRPAVWDSAAVAPEVYEQITRSISSAESPVGIDAKHTHVLILHALEQIERRLDPGTATHDDGAGSGAADPSVEAEVRRQAIGMLSRTPAYPKLEDSRRETLADSVTGLALRAARGHAAAVDLPRFVAELLEGVFEAVVNLSIRQMEAYAELLEDATSAIDEFTAASGTRVLSRQRQQLLATMVLLGVSRMKVGRRRVKVRTISGDDRDDDD